LGINLQKNPRFLNFYFFNIFYAKKMTCGIARVSKLVVSIKGSDIYLFIFTNEGLEMKKKERKKEI